MHGFRLPRTLLFLLPAACPLLALSLGNHGPLPPGRDADPHPAERAAQALLATPCVSGMAGTFPCANIDLLAFMPLITVGGGNSNDVWGWTDALNGREYAILGRTTGTSFVDITVPDNPVYLGDLPPHSVSSIWRDVEVFADHAFIVSEAPGHGMQVFDLRQLRSVTNPPVAFTETAHYAGFSTAHTLAINVQSGFAYANGSNTCSGGLHMVNIQNPSNPVNAGCFSADGYTHDSQCVLYNGPDIAHRNKEICFNSNEDTLTIVDVTTKAAPVQLSRTGYSGRGYTHQGWLTDDHAFFLLDDEFDENNLGTNTRTHIWDVSDVDVPQRTGIYEAATTAIDHNQYVRGNFVYQANYRSGLRILDITSISTATLREVAYFDIYPADDNPQFNGAWSAFPFFSSGVVLVSGIEQGLFILRPNLSGNPMGLPNFLMSASPTSATVRSGQSASFTLMHQAQNGFSGMVSLSCTGLPPRANCSFNPATLDLAGGTASATLTITTAAPPPADLAGARPPAIPPWALLAFALCFWARWESDWPARKKSPWLLVVVAAAALLAVSCGGDGSFVAPPPPPPPPPPPTGTPPGTHSITVRATSGSLAHSTTISLVVQ